jgi:hypothetical protein
MAVYSANSFTSAARSSYDTVTLTLTPTATYGAAPTASDTVTVAFKLSDITGTSTAVTSLIAALFCS